MTIYFIASPPSQVGHVKIGFSETEQRAARRLREHQTSNGLRLEMLAMMDGDRDEELALHALLTRWSAPGGREWFDRAVVESLLATVSPSACPSDLAKAIVATHGGDGDALLRTFLEGRRSDAAAHGRAGHGSCAYCGGYLGPRRERRA